MYTAALTIFKTVFIELVYAPLWWYTSGTKRALARSMGHIKYANDYLGVTVWTRNLFVPMYGQWDITGRIISVIIRFLQIIVRAAVFLLWTVSSLIILAIYLTLPLVILWQISVIYGIPDKLLR